MGMWLDFIQVALALGAGWLGWVLFRIARGAPAAARPSARAGAASAPRTPPVVTTRALDGEL